VGESEAVSEGVLEGVFDPDCWGNEPEGESVGDPEGVFEEEGVILMLALGERVQVGVGVKLGVMEDVSVPV